MNRCHCSPLLLSPFTPTPPPVTKARQYSQMLHKLMRAGCGSLQSQLLLLPNWPEIVLSEAKNAPPSCKVKAKDRASGLSSFCWLQKHEDATWVSLWTAPWRLCLHLLTSQLTHMWTLSAREMPFESMSLKYLLGIRFQTLDHLYFWSTEKHLEKRFMFWKSLYDLQMLEINIIQAISL